LGEALLVGRAVGRRRRLHTLLEDRRALLPIALGEALLVVLLAFDLGRRGGCMHCSKIGAHFSFGMP